MLFGTIRSHATKSELDFCFLRTLALLRVNRPYLVPRRLPTISSPAFFLCHFRATPSISKSHFQTLHYVTASGQNAAASAKDRRAFARCRGQMTHAGLAVMAVAARLGPA